MDLDEWTSNICIVTLYHCLRVTGRPQSATTIGHSGAVPTIHKDNNRKARIPLHSTSHLVLAAKDSSGQ